MFGHLAKPVEPYIRHRCHTDIDPVTFERPVRNRTLRIHTLVFYNGLTISWRTRNPNSPANAEAAQLWQENRREYAKRVQQVVEQSPDLDIPEPPARGTLDIAKVLDSPYFVS